LWDAGAELGGELGSHVEGVMRTVALAPQRGERELGEVGGGVQAGQLPGALQARERRDADGQVVGRIRSRLAPAASPPCPAARRARPGAAASSDAASPRAASTRDARSMRPPAAACSSAAVSATARAARAGPSGRTCPLQSRSADATKTFVSWASTVPSSLSMVSSRVCHHHGKPDVPKSRSVVRPNSVSWGGSWDIDMKALGNPIPQKD